MMDKTTEEAIQKRDIIVTQIINELGVTIETNTKLLIHCKECKHQSYCCRPCCKDDYSFCSDGERSSE